MSVLASVFPFLLLISIQRGYKRVRKPAAAKPALRRFAGVFVGVPHNREAVDAAPRRARCGASASCKLLAPKSHGGDLDAAVQELGIGVPSRNDFDECCSGTDVAREDATILLLTSTRTSCPTSSTTLSFRFA